jgi:hypothetical protein
MGCHLFGSFAGGVESYAKALATIFSSEIIRWILQRATQSVPAAGLLPLRYRRDASTGP